MPQPRRVLPNSEADDYPARPDVQRPIDQDVPKNSKRTIILLSVSYFIVGFGESICGFLFPIKAAQLELASYISGIAISLNYLICFLSYPLACRLVTLVPYKLSLCISLFILGASRLLFGTLNLISEPISFAAVAFAVKVIDGISLSLLLTSTTLVISSQPESTSNKALISAQISFTTGLTLGSISAGALQGKVDFDLIFYVLGGLTAVCFLFSTIFLPSVSEQLGYEEMPVVSWLKDRNTLIYFVITTFSLVFAGFVFTSLVSLIRKVTENNLYGGLIFAIAPFVYSVTALGWIWVCKVGLNGVMLAFIGCLIIVGSQILYGPATITGLNVSYKTLCSALFLLGLGTACKVLCCIESARRDKRLERNRREIEKRFTTIASFYLGVLLGFSLGCIVGGVTLYYVKTKRIIPALIAIESVLAIGVVIFAFSRNYISLKRIGTREERERIIGN